MESQPQNPEFRIKETRSVTMNIFRKISFLFKSFVKIELSYVFIINMFSTAKVNYLIITVVFLLFVVLPIILDS